MEDNTTATLMDLAVTKEVSSAATEIPSKAELLSASTEEAQSTTKAPSPGLTLSPFADCVAAVSSIGKSGIDAISALPSKLQ
jgi:hypothetical protein